MTNVCVLIGRITKDIEVRKTSNGLSFARFTLAVNRMKDKDGNQQTDFINCVAWRGTADFLGRYTRKGHLISVQGSIQTGSYDDKNGNKVFTTDILCNQVNSLEKRDSTPNNQPTQQINTNTMINDAFDNGPTLDIDSDDLPF